LHASSFVEVPRYSRRFSLGNWHVHDRCFAGFCINDIYDWNLLYFRLFSMANILQFAKCIYTSDLGKAAL